MKEIHLVASPTAMGKIPVAIGSRVPPCPIFFIFNNLEILVTAWREVIPDCLSSIIQPLILFMIINLSYYNENLLFFNFLYNIFYISSIFEGFVYSKLEFWDLS